MAQLGSLRRTPDEKEPQEEEIVRDPQYQPKVS